jgi:hypothetical protein
MKINLNNYEACFLDYHEGNLSANAVKELMQFLQEHPELREEFESFEAITIKDEETISFEEKDNLKKQTTTINASNFDEFAIEFMEGTLPATLQQELKTFVNQNPEYKKELDLYAKTKLMPDTTIVFEHKESLKRRTARVAAWYYWSAAASVALIVGLYFMLHQSKPKVQDTVASQEQINKGNNTANNKVVVGDTNTGGSKNGGTPSIPKTTKNTSVAKAEPRHKAIPGKTISRIVREDSSVADNNEVLPAPQININPDSVSNTTVVAKVNAPDTIYVYKPIIKYSTDKKTEKSIAATDKNRGQKKRTLLAFFSGSSKSINGIARKSLEMFRRFDHNNNIIAAAQPNKNVDFLQTDK